MRRPCPCDSNLPYGNCCQPLHSGEPAPSARALMRSRYSAYALANADYLKRSWHASTRPATLAIDPTTKWLGLTIKATNSLSETEASVEFVARLKQGGGRAERLHETSRFVLENGHWYYVDGVIKA